MNTILYRILCHLCEYLCEGTKAHKISMYNLQSEFEIARSNFSKVLKSIDLGNHEIVNA